MAPINLPDGTEVAEVILPDGASASAVIAPDGRTVFSTIPDSAIAHYVGADYDESGGEWPTRKGSFDLSATGDPQLITDELNGEDVVRTDGTNDYLDVEFSTVAQPVTHFIVVKARDDFSDIFDSNDSNTRHFFEPTDTDWRIKAGSTLEDGSRDSNFHVFTAVFDGANSFLRVDGAESFSGDAGGNGFAGLTLGADAPNNTFQNADYAEYIPCDGRVSDNDIDKEEQRLADKYGITLA